MGGDKRGNSQQISIPKPTRGGPEGWRDEESVGMGRGGEWRTSAGIMITVAGRYEE